MNLKKLTPEEQEKKIIEESQKAISIKPKKPGFSQFLLHDPKAFKITYFIGIIGGTLVILALLILSLIFNFNIFFKILFGVLLIIQLWNSYKLLKIKKVLKTTLNETLYGGKYDSSRYKETKYKYEKNKHPQVG